MRFILLDSFKMAGYVRNILQTSIKRKMGSINSFLTCGTVEDHPPPPPVFTLIIQSEREMSLESVQLRVRECVEFFLHSHDYNYLHKTLTANQSSSPSYTRLDLVEYDNCPLSLRYIIIPNLHLLTSPVHPTRR
jgi:hypothetical protein